MVFAIGALAGCLKPSDKKPEENQNTQPEPEPPQTPPDEDKQPPPKETPHFGLTIQPTLESIQKDLIDVYCISCHTGNTPPAKLNLVDLGKFTDPHAGHNDPNGYHGRLIVPGKPQDSMLHIVIKSTRARDQMPPSTSGIPVVTAEQIESVDKWITSLAPADDGGDDEPGDDGGGDDEPGGDGGGDDEPGDDGGGSDEP